MFTIPGYFCLLSLKAELTHLRLTLGRGREEPEQEQNCFFFPESSVIWGCPGRGLGARKGSPADTQTWCVSQSQGVTSPLPPP